MTRCRKYISVLLLLVFSCLFMPPVVLHQLFADHHDTVCDFKHQHEVTTVEAQHIHCSFFTVNAPLGDPPELLVLQRVIQVLIAELDTPVRFFFPSSTFCFLPARAPPLV